MTIDTTLNAQPTYEAFQYAFAMATVPKLLMASNLQLGAGGPEPNIRLGISEPVFANIRHALGLDRFTLRGKQKVDIQWNLFCIVHNLLKVHRYGAGFA